MRWIQLHWIGQDRQKEFEKKRNFQKLHLNFLFSHGNLSWQNHAAIPLTADVFLQSRSAMNECT